MSTKMKKLVVGITAPGSVNLLKGQMRYFTDLGYETFLMAPKHERTDKYCADEGCKLLPIKINREISFLSDYRSLINIIKTLRKVQPDIVNFGTPKMGLLGMLGAKICGVKRRIYTCRGFRYEPEQGLRRWILKKTEWLSGVCAQDIICISPSLKMVGIRDHIFKENKCKVINKGSSNGIDLKRFNRNNLSEVELLSLRAKLYMKNEFVYGIVGRIIDRKGISELYNAFCRIYDNDKNTRLLIVGSVEDSQISDKSIIAAIKTHEGVLMVGRQDEIPLYLSLMDVFVLPGWGEGFGNVLIEAAALGVPVISTFATGVCDAVCNKFNGLLVDVKDENQLQKAMEDLKRDKNKRRAFGQNGVEWARNFDSRIIWKGMEEFYSSEKV